VCISQCFIFEFNLRSIKDSAPKEENDRTIVWKQECSWTKKGGLFDSASTRFSTIVHSTSSSWIMISFFKILMAYSSSVPFLSASKTLNWIEPIPSKYNRLHSWIFFRKSKLTLPKLPLPSTVKKLKSLALTISLLPILCGTSLSCAACAFFVTEAFYVKSTNSPYINHSRFGTFISWDTKRCLTNSIQNSQLLSRERIARR